MPPRRAAATPGRHTVAAAATRHSTAAVGVPMSQSVLRLVLHDAGALASVAIIDLVLAGDNAVVVGLAAAGLPTEQRRPV
ncbi:MAG TPA: hypothetical protein VME41_08570, partial [Stellaceae bacterium]|nr:hypothetical protein [Stellaceae bacterium]